MSVLHQLNQSLLTAAELAALLFVVPAFGSESLIDGAPASAIEIEVRDARAHVTLTRHIYNDGATPLDLGRALPAIDRDVESLQIFRATHVVNVHADGDCADHLFATGASAHVRMAVDEAVADALLLAPGDAASIEIAASHPLPASGAISRLELPWLKDTAPQAIVSTHDDGTAVLLVVPHAATRGKLVLQMRPAGLPARRIELGEVESPGTVFLLALDRVEVAALGAGAIELEWERDEQRIWSTLALTMATPPAALAVDSIR